VITENNNSIHGIPSHPYKFAAYRNAGLNHTSSGNNQVIPMDTVVFDPNGNFNTTTGGYTVPVTGYYHINAIAVLAGAAGGSASAQAVRIFRDPGGVGSPAQLLIGNLVYVNNTVDSGLVVAGLAQLNAGDIIYVYVIQAHGIASKPYYVGSVNSRFSGHLISV
jgi:hypothetical protein